MGKNEKHDQARAQECMAGLKRLRHYVTRKQKADVNVAITFLEKIILTLDFLEGKPGVLNKVWEEGRKSEKLREEERRNGQKED